MGGALGDLLGRELERFELEHPRSRELSKQAETSLLAGVSQMLRVAPAELPKQAWMDQELA